MQNADGVLIRCSDNSSYQGDILVGADGAYSAVRQTLYKQLSRQNKLPQCDEEQMSVSGERSSPKRIVSCTCLNALFPNATVDSRIFFTNRCFIDKLLDHGRDHQRA